MSPENTNILWRLIQEAGDVLKNKLPEHPNHPRGRSSYAHVAICIKEKFNASYKDIEDEKFDDVKNYIYFLKKNPKELLIWKIILKLSFPMYISSATM